MSTKIQQDSEAGFTTIDDLNTTKINNSNEELYQSKRSSVTYSYTKETDTLEKNIEEQKIDEPNFKTKSELIRFSVLMIGIILSMFMMSLNSTVVAPAMTIIATDLNALDKQTWIATAYLVAVNSFQPLSGKFSDIFGRKAVYLFGIILFFFGSLINALSKNINMLIAGRAIQGFGGGGIMSIVFIVVTDVTPFNLRPRFQSLLAVVYGIASVVGPLLGGAFVDHASWHWDFWLNIILGGISFIFIAIFLKETSTQSEGQTFKQKLARIDWFGSVFSIAFIVCLLLALSWGNTYGWSDAHSIGPFVAAAVALIGLVITEGWIAKEPLLPARVLFNPACLIVYIYMATLGLTFVGTMYFGPIYYQAVFGANSTESGLRLIPFMVCLIAGSVGCGILLRKFPNTKYYIIVGAAANVLGYGLFYTINIKSNWGQQAGYLAFCGFAFGLSQQNCILTAQQSVDKKDIAVATSTINFMMMLASSVGVAIYQVMFGTFLKQELAKLSMEDVINATKYGALKNFLYIRNMPASEQIPLLTAYSDAIHKVFILPICVSALGFICALLCKNVRFEPSMQGAAAAPAADKDSIVIDEEKK